MAPHSRTLAWKIPWTGDPGRLLSLGSHRVGHDWSDLAAAAAAAEKNMKELDYCKIKGQTYVSSKKLRENLLFSLLESTFLYFCVISSQEERDFFPFIYCFKCMSKIIWPYFFEDVYLDGTKLSNQIHIQTHILMHVSGWVCILEWVTFPFSRGSSQPRD